jgi:flagellar biosynthesis/type III secretory pathway M-ring protein FliF/YscJ
MRERAFTTSVIWIALAISIDRILASLRYTELVASPMNPSDVIQQTAFVSTEWQIGAGILIFVLIIAAAGVTTAIWQSTAGKESQTAQQQSEKAKRDNRDARIKRLVATFDDDDLDALEQGRIDEEGERLSLESLLRKRG